MVTLPEARELLAEVGMVDGLPYEQVHHEIAVALRVGECLQRRLAFFLLEMGDRGLFQRAGCSSLQAYAERHHGLDRRRVREILRVGRRLRELAEVDRAFSAHELSWSQVLLLLRVVTVEHEAAWVKRAKELSCKELALQVRLHRFGQAPRKPGEGKGTPEVRFDVRFRLGADAHAKQELAIQKLAAETGRTVTGQDLHETMLDLYLQLESTGKVEGFDFVPSSLYRVHLYPLVPGGGADTGLFVDTEAGLVPLDGIDADGLEAKHRTACARCDGECVGDGHPVKDEPTPSGMRRRVMARDGDKCRCCGSRRRLHVHHIVFRAEGGRTKVYNLLTVCSRCHALLHEGLVVIEGTTQKKARFVDREGRPLHGDGTTVDPGHLVPIEPPPARPLAERLAIAGRRGDEPTAAFAVPETVDGAWWRTHADRIQCRADRTLVYEPDAPLREVPVSRPPREDGDERAFGTLIGQDALVKRLETEVRGAKALGVPFPHTLLAGPAGTGKTTIARLVARRIGARVVRKNGPTLGDVPTLLRLLASLEDGDVLFLDEIHAVPRGVLEVLYEALDDGRLSLTFRHGATEHRVGLTLARFTLVGATTKPADLPPPLRSRMQLQEHLLPYEAFDLARQARAEAERRGFTLEGAAALVLASRARGIPREVLRLTERALSLAASRGQWAIDVSLVETMLEQQGFDAEGLKPLERRYLEVLGAHGGAVALGRLADLLRLDVATVRHEIEPELVARHLVRITERGRLAPPSTRVGLRALPPGKQGSLGRRTFAASPRSEA